MTRRRAHLEGGCSTGARAIAGSPRAGDRSPGAEVAVLIQNRPFLGALLVHLPLLHALRAIHADARLTLYSPFPGARQLVDLAAADEVVHYSGILSLGRVLRARRPARVVSLRRKSARVALAVAASRAQDTVGFRYGLNPVFFRRAVPRDKQVYRAVSFLDLVTPRDGAAARVQSAMDTLAGRSVWQPSVEGRSYCLIPCCSRDEKQWGLDRFARYASAWLARDSEAHVIWILGPRERWMAREIARDLPVGRATCLVEPSLGTIARAVRASRVTVTNDCAPGHLAQMSGAPVVTLFGDWDGRGARRVAEWFYDRPGAACVTARPSVPTAEIPLTRVFEASVALAEAQPAARRCSPP